MIYKDYKPVVRSFLHQAHRHGWKVASATHEENVTIKFDETHGLRHVMDKTLDHVLATEQCVVRLVHKDGYKIGALILLGNNPDELVADWSYPTDEADAEFSKMYDKFTSIWEGKPTPMKEIA